MTLDSKKSDGPGADGQPTWYHPIGTDWFLCVETGVLSGVPVHPPWSRPAPLAMWRQHLVEEPFPNGELLNSNHISRISSSEALAGEAKRAKLFSSPLCSTGERMGQGCVIVRRQVLRDRHHSPTPGSRQLKTQLLGINYLYLFEKASLLKSSLRAPHSSASLENPHLSSPDTTHLERNVCFRKLWRSKAGQEAKTACEVAGHGLVPRKAKRSQD